MNFIVGAEKGLAFYQEETAFTGVNKIADKIRKTFSLLPDSWRRSLKVGPIWECTRSSMVR